MGTSFSFTETLRKYKRNQQPYKNDVCACVLVEEGKVCGLVSLRMIKSKIAAVKLFGTCLDVMLKTDRDQLLPSRDKMNELYPQKNILISIRGIFITLGVTPPCTCKAEQNENNHRIP